MKVWFLDVIAYWMLKSQFTIERFGRKETRTAWEVLSFYINSIRARIHHALFPGAEFENSPIPKMKVNCLWETVAVNSAFLLQLEQENVTIEHLSVSPNQSVYIGDRVYRIERTLIGNNALIYTFEDETKSRTDHLTGLRNRIAFEEDLKSQISSVNRNAESSDVSVVFIDLNNFKRINDTKGHAIGDRALKGFSSVLENTLRPADGKYRLSGDEFVLLLEWCDEVAWWSLERRLREALQPLNQEIWVDWFGFSAGVLKYDPMKYSNMDTFKQEVDNRMYAQKNFHKAEKSLSKGRWMDALEQLAEAIDHMKRCDNWKSPDYERIRIAVISHEVEIQSAINSAFMLQSSTISHGRLRLLEVSFQYILGQANTALLDSTRDALRGRQI